jgi:hypothetical protein
MKAIPSPKDFWAGVIYVGTGLAALWLGSEYRMGSAGRMGPGYFPRVLAVLLLCIGIVALVRAFVAKGSPIGMTAWKPLLIVLVSCALFGLALPRLGLGAALFLLCFGSAMASREFRFDPFALAGLLGLIVFCAVVFVKGLGVPMPLLGSWLEPVLGDTLPWLR